MRRIGRAAVLLVLLQSIVVTWSSMQPAHADTIPAAFDGTWTLLPPPPLKQCSMIYDSARDRVVLFGGNDVWERSEVWQTPIGSSRAWTELRPSTPGPGQRQGHSAVYDPLRKRMLVFGGFDQSLRHNDVWAFDLAGGPAWTQLTPSGTPPPVRDSQSMIYDSLRDRLVVFGGFPFMNDVWALTLSGTPTWSQITPAGTPPSARYGAAAIYDPVGDRMIVHGGTPSSSDTWALSFSGTPTWSLIAASGTPPGYTYAGSFYDPARDRMVLILGTQIRALSLAGSPAWSAITPSGSPPSAGFGIATVYDSQRDRLVSYGVNATLFRDELWAVNLPGSPIWTELAPPSYPAPVRRQHTMVYDDSRHRMVVFGGVDQYLTYHNDVWICSLDGYPTWTQLMPTGTPPSGRARHAAIYDPAGDRMIVFGGYNGSSFDSDVWALSFSPSPAWTQLTPAGAAPFARAGHSAVYDATYNSMIVFGGEDGSGKTNSIEFLELSGSTTWIFFNPSAPLPSARIDHSAVVDPVRRKMLVFGGQDNSGQTNDTWSLDIGGVTWTQLAPTGTLPFARSGHCAIVDPVRERMIVFSGDVSGTAYSDTRALELHGAPVWSWLAPAGAEPAPRSYGAAIYDPAGDRMIVFGGWNFGFGDYYSDLPSLYWSAPADVEPDASGSGGDSSKRDALLRIAPNPFNPETLISFRLEEPGTARLEVFDVQGRLVRTLLDAAMAKGEHEAHWDGRDRDGRPVSSGVYFCRLEAPGCLEERGMVLTK